MGDDDDVLPLDEVSPAAIEAIRLKLKDMTLKESKNIDIDKKALYESLMNKVAKEVKKTLNEAITGKLKDQWDNYDRCKAEAETYLSKSEFFKRNPYAYGFAREHGWLDEFFPKGQQHRWSKEEVKNLFRQCEGNLNMIKHIDFNAFIAGKKHGWFDEFEISENLSIKKAMNEQYNNIEYRTSYGNNMSKALDRAWKECSDGGLDIYGEMEMVAALLNYPLDHLLLEDEDVYDAISSALNIVRKILYLRVKKCITDKREKRFISFLSLFFEINYS